MFWDEFSGGMGSFDVSPFQPHLVTWLIRCERLRSLGHESLGFYDAILHRLSKVNESFDPCFNGQIG